ncbi:u3 small nucleolar rna-associated protein 4 [Holotrichia oblita]|uniref:U3 small nucleolar rna-associated protein 4 n=1 Tax=Holotrichia oblita TaxID=644536 RepID=A0ACB9TXL0_HOLOL|nr:u3 small nucleolar rna-associated protein 4 [Holotrichia oblita]
MVKIHNVKFYKPDPRVIYSISFQKTQRKLAVLRSDSCIEIWNLKDVPYIEKIIPSVNNYNVQQLVWSKDRLFSCTLQGFLHEYNLLTLQIKDSQTLVGDAAYCLDVNKTDDRIVVGTENGFLNTFDLTYSDEVKFIRFLDKQDGKILCVKYDYTGKYIVSSGMDAVRIWDANSGNALHKMTTGRTEIHKPTIVWCLDVMKDFTIITGDSRGKLTFWDGKIGSQIESYQSHKADILCLALSEDEETVFCGGVDPILVSYVKIKIKEQNEKWVKSIQRKVHDHDVRDIILVNNKLYSGGVDGYLACSYHPPKTIIKYPPFVQNHNITIAKLGRVILLQYPEYLEVWNLGITTPDPNENGSYQLTNNAKKLLRLERSVKNDSQENYSEMIICSSISSDGKYIAFSCISGCRLYEFEFDDLENPKIKRIKHLPAECGAAIKLIFTPLNKELIVILLSGDIIILDLDKVVVRQKIEASTFFRDTVFHSTISIDGRYLVVADTQSNIIIWARNAANTWKFYHKLPQYKFAPTAMEIQPTTTNIWIAYSDHKIVEYSIQEKRFTIFSRTLDSKIVENYVNKRFPIRNITFDVKNKDIVLIHDDTNIVVVKKNVKSIESSSKMAKKAKKNEANSDNCKSYFNTFKKYQHLVHLETLSEDEIVAVEVTPSLLMEKLPPCLKQNTFGTK